MLRSAGDMKVFLNYHDITRGEVTVNQVYHSDSPALEAAAAPGPPPPPSLPYKTLTKLYVRRTGHEVGVGSGENCEIKGWCNLDNAQMSIDINLPQDHDFSDQNGGLGFLVVEKELKTPSRA